VIHNNKTFESFHNLKVSEAQLFFLSLLYFTHNIDWYFVSFEHYNILVKVKQW